MEQFKNEMMGSVKNAERAYECFIYLIQRDKTITDIEARLQTLKQTQGVAGTSQTTSASPLHLPEAAVVGFASNGCPDGWIPFRPASGRFLVGVADTEEVAIKASQIKENHPSFTLPYHSGKPKFKPNLPYRTTVNLAVPHLARHTHWHFQKRARKANDNGYFSSHSVQWPDAGKSVHHGEPEWEGSANLPFPEKGTYKDPGPYTWLRTKHGEHFPFLSKKNHGHEAIAIGGTFAPAVERPAGQNKPINILPPYLPIYFCVRDTTKNNPTAEGSWNRVQ